jgi:4'-phosphopantetheinyl transferase EntD
MIDDLKARCPKGLSVGSRIIQSNDAGLLLPEEKATLLTKDARRLNASGAARFISRQLLAERGVTNFPVERARSGEPIWPKNIVGSLAHDDELAVAAIGCDSDYLGLGIDVEPATPLPNDIKSLVRISEDIDGDDYDTILVDRVLFCAKEAVYKAVYPLDRLILNYDDIRVDLPRRTAYTITGREVFLTVLLNIKVVVVAVLPKLDGQNPASLRGL